MGHRASLVIITGAEPELYYSQWHATTLDAALFWGPEHATAFARSQNRQQASEALLVDAWTEGGALIDHRRRSLLWYGGDDIRFDIPRRRLHLSLMRGLWPGWQVHWAAEGIADIADGLQLPRASVLCNAPTAPPDSSWVFQAPEDSSWLATVISRTRRSSIDFVTADCGVPELLGLGQSLVTELEAAPHRESLDWFELTPEFPTGGIHIDMDSQTISYWFAEDSPGLTERTRLAFPDWKTVSWGDAYERQVELGRGALRLPVPDARGILKTLQAYLLEYSGDCLEPTSSILNKLEDDDGLVAPGNALAQGSLVPPSERQRLLASVLPPAPQR